MEYLILLFCIVPIWLIKKYIWLAKPIVIPSKIQHSQSRNMLMFGKILEAEIAGTKKPNTQSINYINKNHLRVMVVDNNAYWIKNNTFYVADLVDGQIDNETTREVDTMTMDKVQLDKMLFIVGKLTEGLNNESRDQWNS